MRRRAALLHAARGTAALLALAGAAPVWPLPPRTLRFPRDFGSHPELRTEWWYITGHARAGSGTAAREVGFQVTFFRTRVDEAQTLRSAFAAKQLVVVHAAVTDLQGRRLWHDQRIARAAMGVAGASEADTALRLRDWSLVRDGGDGSYRAIVEAADFGFDLRFRPTQPVLLQGDAGLSRKGPEPDQASYYYSEPQLETSGRLRLAGRDFDVAGTAWLDHEWSEALLHPDAAGWDWIGMNLDDGSALTAFEVRKKTGGALWSGGSFRKGAGPGDAAKVGDPRVFAPNEVAFEPLRRWQSPVTRARYPVEWAVRTPAGRFRVRALLDDQELDSRGASDAIYWEGLSELLDARGAAVGRGYLEMTGYAAPLRL